MRVKDVGTPADEVSIFEYYGITHNHNFANYVFLNECHSYINISGIAFDRNCVFFV